MTKEQYKNYVKENKIQIGTVLKVIPQERCDFKECEVVVLDTELTCELDGRFTTELHYRYDFKNLLIVRLKEDVEVKSIYDYGYMSYHIKFLELID
jgi:hypothetical protein